MEESIAETTSRKRKYSSISQEEEEEHENDRSHNNNNKNNIGKNHVIISKHLSALSHSSKPQRSESLSHINAYLKNPSPSLLSLLTDNILPRLFQETDPELVEKIVCILSQITTISSDPTIVDALHKYLDARSTFHDSVTTHIVNSLISIEKSTGLSKGISERTLLTLLCTKKVGLKTKVLNLARVSCRGKDEENSQFGGIVFNVFQVFAKNPYPSVRQAALEGLVAMHGKGFLLNKKCYRLGVKLLQDTDELVRISAITVVREWIVMLHHEKDQSLGNLIDEGFLELCSISRDMHMKVRIEVLYALGKMGPVSEPILLQALSKKILKKKSKKSHTPHTEKDLEKDFSKVDFLTLSAAGVFLHGIEDEFFQVRLATINSLVRLSCFSKQFAENALDLLMDMLNDASPVVRMHALCEMPHMAGSSYLNLQEKHMHMLLGMLEDMDRDIRSATRKLLGRVLLPSLSVFEMTVEAILFNVDKYSEDEKHVISVMYQLGQQHVTYLISSMDKFVQQLHTLLKEHMGLDQPRVVALIVLLLGARIADASMQFRIPSDILMQTRYLQADASMQFRIPSDILMQTRYLQGKLKEALGLETFLKLQEFLQKECMVPGNIIASSSISRCKESGNNTDISEAVQEGNSAEEKAVLHTISSILKSAVAAWSLMKYRVFTSILETLSGCKKDLGGIIPTSELSKSLVAFSLHYLHALYLLVKLEIQLMPNSFQQTHQLGMYQMHIFLDHLEDALDRLSYCFMGLSEEQYMRIISLDIFSCLLRLSLLDFSDPCNVISRLKLLVSASDLLEKKHGLKIGVFIQRVKELLMHENPTPLSFLNLLKGVPEQFSLEPMPLNTNMAEMRASIDVADNSLENPLHFVTGLPVEISMQINLYNISFGCSLWLSMKLGDDLTYRFLDVSEFKCNGCMKCGKVTVPFYATQRVDACLLEVSLMMKCTFYSYFKEILEKEHNFSAHESLVRISPLQNVYLIAKSNLMNSDAL